MKRRLKGRGASAGKKVGCLPSMVLQLFSILWHLVKQQGGLAGRPPRRYSKPSQPCPLGCGDSHWLWNTALHIGASPSDSSGYHSGVGLRTQQGPCPGWGQSPGVEGRSPGEQPGPPAGTLPGCSILRERAEKVSQGASCGKRPCAHTRTKTELVSPGAGRYPQPRQSVQGTGAITLDCVAGRRDIWRGAN